jgi:1,6-anhydro-N-acetylmuramate kinase
VAATVADALERFAPERPRELLVAGGGARNPAQMAALDFSYRREQLYFEILLDVRDAMEKK